MNGCSASREGCRRRANQALSEEEIREVLRTAKCGVLAMTGDGGRPYSVYVNPFYDFPMDEAAIEKEIQLAGASASRDGLD